MGDWNTLHIFNDRHFYTNIAPDLRNKGELLQRYFNSQLGKYILWDNSNSEVRTRQMVDLCRDLKSDFKVHTTLFEIEARQKKPTEVYADFKDKQSQDYDQFMHAHADAIEDLNRILTLILFTECAAFNPHLVLGRRIFTGNVTAKAGSVASGVIDMIPCRESGSFYYSNMSNCNGLMNWVTYEELQLLWLDKDNLLVPDGTDEQYLTEFLQFVELALQHESGLLSVTNVNEQVLNAIPEPTLQIDIDPKEKGWKSIIVSSAAL